MPPVFPRLRAEYWLSGILLIACSGTPSAAISGEDPGFNQEWRFNRADEFQGQLRDFDDRSWEAVSLPHTPRIEALVSGQNARQWQGICWYRKHFQLPAGADNKEILLRFEGAMNVADVWVNGNLAGHFLGGYLPYVTDISRLIAPGETNVIAVRLDNRDNPITGPKPLTTLDFNLYGGLYRTASLVVKDKLHITDPIFADTVAGGGVFVTFPSVSSNEATVQVRTQIGNSDTIPRSFILKTTLFDAAGNAVASDASPDTELARGARRELVQQIKVLKPNLWSPKSPCLYQLRSELRAGRETIDVTETRVGIRRIHIDKDGFWIKGERMRLRGVNRHQEYPYIGNAVPQQAQYRDALKIKQAGFDYIRLSHYPQSPAFLDACDELGLVVMNSIMGWQYFGRDPAFSETKLRECRQLVRRDRNHPCVILWEVSLNESAMPRSFIDQAHAITHQEYPGDQCFTAGWLEGYDVFMQARQHGGCLSITNKPCVISEYGDWEYYAQNAGFEQNRWKDLQPSERSSRQLRGNGEVRLLQQAMNFQEAHNDNLRTTAFADSAWVMFDYNRGYAPDLESSGIMDIFRIPKFSYWFFRSQRDPNELIAGRPLGPQVFIANYWTAQSPLQVRIFSNCDEIALYLNHRLIERRRPEASRAGSRLNHPPFVFSLDRFEPGTLLAIGYLNGREAARDERRTPGETSRLTVRFDTADRPLGGSGKDAVFCYADARDSAGTLVPQGAAPVFFGTAGAGKIIGANPIVTEAGTATILLACDGSASPCGVYAICLAPAGDRTSILSAAAAPDGSPMPNFAVHYTTDGTDPTMDSPTYSGPIAAARNLRAAIIVNGQTIAVADSRAKAASTSDTTVFTAGINSSETRSSPRGISDHN
ncbi:MAG TPA: glycoside hydrolase family 2 TIM barrel-domain containing protein [Verrucomicrobiae bacterium]|nr:glycoside hydrolase family 2 TIM barrel-domain containing protein [Verrucomicrobiae bacterium]